MSVCSNLETLMGMVCKASNITLSRRLHTLRRFCCCVCLNLAAIPLR